MLIHIYHTELQVEESSTENDFYVKEREDMLKIIQTMLSAGEFAVLILYYLL